MHLMIKPDQLNIKIRRERLYGGIQIRKLREQVEQCDPSYWPQFMINLSNCRTEKPKGYQTQLTLNDVLRREEINQEASGGVDYLSWIVSETSPFSKSKYCWIWTISNDLPYLLLGCKVYTLSNPEEKFWKEMGDPTFGHIGIKKNGQNADLVKKQEELLEQEMSEFRNFTFAYFMMINLIWFIITLVLSLYADILPTISVGTIELEIFSVAFLFIYITIIAVQFICMIWHR